MFVEFYRENSSSKMKSNLLGKQELAQRDGRSLNKQVKRNLQRFPSDFMFKLTAEETASLRSQFE
ncbi:MAG: ORF6N domain-containing protein, partial [Bacteroidales bacterium]|nr:ORF6N domain-containing protein [Bacteroidales bacterium]